MELNLLDKTEIRVENIRLVNANLADIAQVAAEILRLRADEVVVTDVRENSLVIDVLTRTVRAEHVYGRGRQLLQTLSSIPGVHVTRDTVIHSEGILGLIALDEKEAERIIQKSRDIVTETTQAIRRRVAVCPTGSEIQRGMIRDTNTPLIAEFFKEHGFTVWEGPPLPDDESAIASAVVNILDRGYGLIILTGGVGAEDKDRTVEGILKVDPQAATPYITKFEVGTGRHAKDGVKIAVGRVGPSAIVALPGPTREVKACLEVVLQSVKEGWSKEPLAQMLANLLRQDLKQHMTHG
ncbi:MAG: molybdopterin-binding protein [Candidatus Bathyarchaeia archaeon]